MGRRELWGSHTRTLLRRQIIYFGTGCLVTYSHDDVSKLMNQWMTSWIKCKPAKALYRNQTHCDVDKQFSSIHKRYWLQITISCFQHNTLCWYVGNIASCGDMITWMWSTICTRRKRFTLLQRWGPKLVMVWHCSNIVILRVTDKSFNVIEH